MVAVQLVCNFEQFFSRLVLDILVLQVLIWCEPVNLDITYRIVCSAGKSSETFSSGIKNKDTQDLKSNLLKINEVIQYRYDTRKSYLVYR